MTTLNHTPTLLETLVRLGTPLMDAEAANKEVVRLIVDNIKLQTKIDELMDVRSRR